MASSCMCSLAEAERQSACKLMCDLATCKPTALLPLQLLARICTHTCTRNSCTSCRAGRQRPRSGRNGVCSACLRHACQRWFERSKMPLNGPCIPLGAMAAGSLPTGLCQPGLGSGSASPLLASMLAGACTVRRCYPLKQQSRACARTVVRLHISIAALPGAHSILICSTRSHSN